MAGKSIEVSVVENTSARESANDSSNATESMRLLSELVESHYEMAYRYAFRMSGNASDAEEVVQQAYLIAQQRIGQLRDPMKARSWLMAIVRTTFLKSIRKRRPQVVDDNQLDWSSVPTKSSEMTFDQERLTMALDSLPIEYRLTVLMFYFEHMSYKEIADALGIATGTVMSRMSRAKGILKSQLKRSDHE